MLGFLKGNIILPIKPIPRKDWLKGLFHAAVVWQDDFDGLGDFLGVILTTSNKYTHNILMQKVHFNEEYAFGFNNSHFVDRPFLKFGRWGPFEKVGELKPEGISFIEKYVTGKPAEEFERWLSTVSP